MLSQPNYLDIQYFFRKIYEFLTSPHDFIFGDAPLWFVNFSLFFSPLLIAVMIFLIIKIYQVKRKEAENDTVIFYEDTGVDTMRNERWESVERHMDSENPNDWRLAIIEADTILDELVKKMGYEGDTMGERLKNIEISDFTTLQDAWEAHKIRNRIAHEGSTFLLTKREARRVISLYEKVFKEFAVI